MVGSLEADIEGVCNVQYDNRDIIDDFDDETIDDRVSTHFHKMDVSIKIIKIKYYMSAVFVLFFIWSGANHVKNLFIIFSINLIK